MGPVLAAGHVNCDVIVRVDRLPEPDAESAIRSFDRSCGGSAANVAVSLSRLSVPAGIVGSVGTDEAGARAAATLEREGVSTAGLREAPEGPTAVKHVLVDDRGEVALLGTDGVNEAIEPGDVDPERVRRAGHVHLTSQRPATAARIARVASEAGVGVSFDPGRRVGERTYDGVFAHVDTVFATAREAESLPEDGDYALVVTDGADGAELRTAEGRRHHPGFAVDTVDTTGAGDAFAAGFLAATLEGACEKRALAYGNACGAMATTSEGAQTGPDRARLERFLDARN
ncbi:carbohydrate kinase family protein [Saliphagus infecundisoli]|uniref:Carbohydrate kinase family protein n=1 Tax=Saliphagus infecundisoli TaxID=1849069 RepID=A0ABD5QG19_9EURY|nr:PfkB family carbohydrate kinase [Saliphagus infecundisoli]